MTINFQNVKKDQVGNFVECSYDNCFIYSDLPYECDSIMHYYDTAFNTGGKLLALDFFQGWEFALSHFGSSLFHSICSLKKSNGREGIF